jgi:hypothetical protein
MTEEELRTKWTYKEFCQWQAEGSIHPNSTYESYLDMRREQEERMKAGRYLWLAGGYDAHELTAAERDAVDRLYEAIQRNKARMRAEWPEERFNEEQARGLHPPDLTYTWFWRERYKELYGAEEEALRQELNRLMEEPAPLSQAA